MEQIFELFDSGRAQRAGPVMSSRVPYELGWSPKRAARALLCLDYADQGTIRRHYFGEHYRPPDKEGDDAAGRPADSPAARMDLPEGQPGDERR